jgi:hypothetical protein
MFTKETIENYFLHFKHEHLFLLMLAGVSLYLGVKKHFFKGFAIPLFSTAMLLFSIAFSNFNNADRLRKICVYDYDLHPENLKIRELERVDSFIQNVNIIFYSSIFLIITSVCLILYFSKKLNAQYIKGTAASLFLMSLIIATTFFIIKKEAKDYREGIIKFTKQNNIKEGTPTL